MGFQDCKVYVSNVDSQSSASGGIIIQVLGEMSNNSGPWRKFTQTFFLAEQPNGYFVLNDIFRYLKDEDQADEQADEVNEDIRYDEKEAHDHNRDVAGAKVDVSAINQPEATPHVPAVVAAGEPKAAAIAVGTQDNSIADIADKQAASSTFGIKDDASAQPAVLLKVPQQPIESVRDAEAAILSAPATQASEPAEAANPETVSAAAAAAGTTAVAAPVPDQEAKPTGISKPKTWANLAASNATTWGSAVRADAKGVSAAAAAAPASQSSPRPATGARGQGQASGPSVNVGSAQPGAIFIKNVQSDHVSESALRSTLERQFGPLKELQLIASKGCAFATFSKPEDARRAISASSGGGVVVGDQGWKVNIEEKRNKPQGERFSTGTAGTSAGRGGKPAGIPGRGVARNAIRGAKPPQA